jgi:hypothetical protein
MLRALSRWAGAFAPTGSLPGTLTIESFDYSEWGIAGGVLVGALSLVWILLRTRAGRPERR